MKSSSDLSSKMQKFIENDEKNSSMLMIPPKSGRYIVMDTETTGLSSKNDHVVELAAIEVINAKLTGSQFHIYIKPRIIMTQSVIKIHHIDNNFYERNYLSSYESDKANMENFIKFVGNSLIFAHNAPFDMTFINNELRFWGLPTLKKEKFRCTMRIFCNVVNIAEQTSMVMCNLKKCCDYFKLEQSDSMFHTAIYDAIMTAKLLCKIYNFIEMNKSIKENKKLNYASSSIDMFVVKGKRMHSEVMQSSLQPEKKFEMLFKKAKRMKKETSNNKNRHSGNSNSSNGSNKENNNKDISKIFSSIKTNENCSTNADSKNETNDLLSELSQDEINLLFK